MNKINLIWNELEKEYNNEASFYIDYDDVLTYFQKFDKNIDNSNIKDIYQEKRVSNVSDNIASKYLDDQYQHNILKRNFISNLGSYGSLKNRIVCRCKWLPFCIEKLKITIESLDEYYTIANIIECKYFGKQLKTGLIKFCC